MSIHKTGRGVGLLALALGALLGCQDRITAPGACPDFCPQGNIAIIDTVLTGSTESVGSYDGYQLPHESAQMQVVGPAGPAESRALMVFDAFSATYPGGDSTVTDSIASTDSIRFTFNVVRRNTNVTGVTLALHAIPILTDASATYASIAPYFEDSTLVGTFTVPDTLTSGPVSVTVPPGALSHFATDNLQAGVGLSIISTDPAFVSLGIGDSAQTAQITRFVQVDTSDGSKLVTRSDSRSLFFHTFVTDTTALPTPQGLAVGGLTAARAFLKVNVPQQVLDSTLIVRATLLLPQLQPTFGAPGDSVRVRVQLLGADFGPKSPLITTSSDSLQTTLVAVGSADTVAIDITGVLRLWRSNTTLPHNIMLRVVPEAGSIDMLELPPAGTGGGGAIHITYGLPFRLPGR